MGVNGRGGDIVEGSCGYRARRISIRGTFVLSRNPGYKTRGGHHVVKRSSDPWVTHPEVKVQVRDLVRVVGIVAHLPHGGSVFGESSLYRAPAGRSAQDRHRRPVPGAPSSGTP